MSMGNYRNISPMKYVSILLVILTTHALLHAQISQPRTNVLLIGTFHFSNPGLDVVKQKDFDVLCRNSQKELEFISNKVTAFNPTRIFVEYGYTSQKELDSLYQVYLTNKNSFRPIKKYNRYTREDEIFQLGFRIAEKAKIIRVDAINSREFNFPYDSLLAAMKEANQLALLAQNQSFIATIEEEDEKRTAETITQRILSLNTPAERRRNRSWYLTIANRGGKNDNFVGAYLNSEWYRRNLYMYSLIQKLTAATDKRIVVLLGAGHIAMLEQFIRDDDRFEIVELKDVLN